jgi:hypothetical protein
MSADETEIETPSDGEQDEEVLAEDEVIEDLEPTADDIAEGGVTPEPGLGEVESIQDILAKQETRDAEEEAAEEEETGTPMTKGEALEAAESRVVPIQQTEFMCTNCFLVKHRSQLADKKKMRCRDCA